MSAYLIDFLAVFLKEANLNTYANEWVQKAVSLRPGSSDYHFEKGDLTYHDTYFGATKFIGEEIVYKNGKRAWGMSYYSFTLNSEISECLFDAILRPALMSGSGDNIPVRGPKEFINSEWRYTFNATGNLSNFTVLEEISKNGEVVCGCTAMVDLSSRTHTEKLHPPLIMVNQSPSNFTEFSDPRVVVLYDILNLFGKDSEFFCQQSAKLLAKTIIDLGCGTGLLTCELAKRGHKVTGIEPSKAMLAIAQAKPHAEQIKWIQGSFEHIDGLHADMILMTSHVAQFFLDDGEWKGMLQAAYKALITGGHLVFDIRRLTNPPFVGWPTEGNRRKFENIPAGAVEWWFNLLSVEGERVQYELHYFFTHSGEKAVSVNELVFRSQNKITEALSQAGFEIETI